MSHLIAPSILSGDFAALGKDIEMINQSEADWFHVDIMDGVFVPNISFGFPVMEAINEHTLKPLDVHLMIVNPDQYISQFKKAGANVLTVHMEACTHLHRTIQAIKAEDMNAGVALNPHTAVKRSGRHHHRYRLGLDHVCKPGLWWPEVYRKHLPKN